MKNLCILLIIVLTQLIISNAYCAEEDKITVSHLGRTLSYKKSNAYTKAAIEVGSNYNIKWVDRTSMFDDKMTIDSFMDDIAKKGVGNDPFFVYFTHKLPPYAEMVPVKGFKDPPLTTGQKLARRINISAFWSPNFDVEIIAKKFECNIVFLKSENHKLATTLVLCMPDGTPFKTLSKSQITSSAMEKNMREIIKRMPKDISKLFTDEINADLETARTKYKARYQKIIEESKK